MSSARARKLLLALIAAAVVAFFVLDLGRYLTVEEMAARREAVQAYRAEHPAAVALAFLLAYVAMAAVSLPGASLMTLAGGAVFGLGLGTLLVSFASSIGATLAFLSARFILRDWVQARLGHRLEALNEGVRRDGAYYLLTLRLLPVFPFWVVNLVLGLTPIRTWTFYWASQLGMLPATVIYVYAGTQLTQFRIGPGLVIALTLLAGFALVAGRVIESVNARRIYRRWNSQRPERFDYNVVVVGAGSAGLVAPTSRPPPRPRWRWSRSTAWAATVSTPDACPARRCCDRRNCSPRSRTRATGASPRPKRPSPSRR